MKRVIVLTLLTALLYLFAPGTAFASSVVLNELLPDPSSGNEWIEIYNNTSESVNLGGWTIEELTASGNITPHPLPNVVLPSQQLCFYQFGVNVYKLNDAGDTVTLKNNYGEVKDSIKYPDTNIPIPKDDESLARVPDGGNWVISSSPIKTSSECSTLSTASPSPSPSPTPTFSPSPTPTSAPKPSLIISNIPSSARVDQEFSVNVTANNFSPNSAYYLKGVFRETGSANYFGQTKVGDSWVKNSAKYDQQFPITTDSQGSWSGTVTVKGDASDRGFSGAGDYLFKVGYYQDPSVSWSNEASIKLDNPAAPPRPSPSPTPTPKPSPKVESLDSDQTAEAKTVLPPSILGSSSASTGSTGASAQVAGFSLNNLYLVGAGMVFILSALLVSTFLFKKRVV